MEELFEQHAEKLFVYLRQHAPSREDAEDILVETFLAALTETKFMHLSDMAQVAWLWRLARNKATDAFRQAAFRRNISLEQVGETMYEDETKDPEDCSTDIPWNLQYSRVRSPDRESRLAGAISVCSQSI